MNETMKKLNTQCTQLNRGLHNY